VIHAQPLGGESFALGQAADDAPKSWHRRGNCRNAGFGQWRTGGIVAPNHHYQELWAMPLMLTDAERAMLDALAAPIDADRRPEFLGAVTPSSRLQAQPSSDQALCIEPRARCCVIFGTRRRTFVKAVSDLEGPGANVGVIQRKYRGSPELGEDG
jgi:hypothetical protein